MREIRMGGQVTDGLERYQKDFGFYPEGVGDCSWFSALKWEWGKPRGMQQEVEGDAEAGPQRQAKREQSVSEQAAVVVPVLVLVPRETSLHPRLRVL